YREICGRDHEIHAQHDRMRSRRGSLGDVKDYLRVAPTHDWGRTVELHVAVALRGAEVRPGDRYLRLRRSPRWCNAGDRRWWRQGKTQPVAGSIRGRQLYRRRSRRRAGRDLKTELRIRPGDRGVQYRSVQRKRAVALPRPERRSVDALPPADRHAGVAY